MRETIKLVVLLSFCLSFLIAVWVITLHIVNQQKSSATKLECPAPTLNLKLSEQLLELEELKDQLIQCNKDLINLSDKVNNRIMCLPYKE